METSKKWWESKTVWGGIIALIAGIAGAFGTQVGIEDQEAAASVMTALASAIGGAIAVYGRMKADTTIK
jgi:uncharacterized membrane protein (DUF441 family)